MVSSPSAVVIVAAGTSSRMGFDKVTAPLAGHPLLWHSLQAFSQVPFLEQIILVCSEGRVEEMQTIAAEFPRCRDVVVGGQERMHSVLAGLAVVREEIRFVAVHDAGRPLIASSDIEGCFVLAQQTGAAVCAEPATDTLHRADSSGKLLSSVERDGLWRMQTPQIFPPKEIQQVCKQLLAKGRTATDEAGAYLQTHRSVMVYSVNHPNFKITYPSDLSLAEAYLQIRSL